MNRIHRRLIEVASILNRSPNGWALVGGLAVSARAEPRFTRDLDIAAAVSDDREAEDLIRLLGSRGYRPIATVEQDAADRLATVRLLPPEETETGLIIDLLFASSGIENEIVQNSDEVEIMEGLVVPLASVGHLLAMKVLSQNDTSRPQDIADIRTLLAIAKDSDVEQTRAALCLITERGYNRDRNLEERFETLLEQSRGHIHPLE